MKKLAVFMAVLLTFGTLPVSAWASTEEPTSLISNREDNQEAFYEEENFYEGENFKEDTDESAEKNQEPESEELTEEEEIEEEIEEDEPNEALLEKTNLWIDGLWETTGVIADENDLIDFLNYGGQTETGQTYILDRTITIKASDLSETNYTSFILRSSLDGQGNTIIIEGDSTLPSRPLFYSIISPSSAAEPITVKDLNIVYEGDVNVSAFCMGAIGRSVIKNINITVEGDIVANNSPSESNLGTRAIAYGFANRIWDDYGKVTLNNITITAQTIGKTDATPSSITGIRSVSGFSNCIGYNGSNTNTSPEEYMVEVDGIYLNYKDFYASGTSGVIMSGFSNAMYTLKDLDRGETYENIHVFVENDMYAEISEPSSTTGEGGLSTYLYYGIYGISAACNKLQNSSVTVGGSMTYLSNTDRYNGGDLIYLSGLVMQNRDRTLAVDGTSNIISGNTVHIGKIHAEGTSQIYVAGAINGHLLASGTTANINSIYSSGNKVTIGEMFAQSTGIASSTSEVTVRGYCNNSVRESIGDIVEIGSITGVSSSGKVDAGGFGDNGDNSSIAAARKFLPMTIKKAQIHIQGDLTAQTTAGTYSAFAYSALYGMLGDTIEDVVIIVDGDIRAESAGGTAYASGLNYYVYNGAEIEDVKIYVYGDISAFSQTGNANATGIAVGAAGNIRDTGIYIAGDIYAEGSGTSGGNAVGFVKSNTAGYTVENCVVLSDGTISSKSGGSAVGESGAFMRAATGEVKGNSAYVKGGVFTYDAQDLVKEEFTDAFIALTSSTADISDNTLFAPYGRDISFINFIGNIAAGTTIGANYYTSILEGHRASNEIQPGTGGFEITTVFPLSYSVAVADLSDYTSEAEYITDLKAHSLNQFSLTGPSGTVLNDTKVSSAYPIALAMLVHEDGPALDIPGLGHDGVLSRVSVSLFKDTVDTVPLGNVPVELKLQGALIEKGFTGADGKVTFVLPFNCITELDYEMIVYALKGYEVISAGDFIADTSGDFGSLTETMSYTAENSFKGVLKADGSDSRFSVTYDGNSSTGGTVPLDSNLYSTADEITVLGNTGSLEKDSESFLGWSKNKYDNTPEYIAGDKISGITEDIILYAVWSGGGAPLPAQSYKVTYYPAGGTGTVYIDQVALADASDYLLLHNSITGFSRTDYTFKGWSLTNGSTAVEFAEGVSYPISADTELYAVWSKNEITNPGTGGGGGSGTIVQKDQHMVTFLMNDETEDVYMEQTVTEGAQVSKPSDPKRTGYEFTGWYLETECKTLYNFEEKVYSKLNLYAGWKEGKIFSDEHMAYIAGYPDGTVRPENNITRAEIAVILFQLFDKDYQTDIYAVDSPFNDVDRNAWYGISVASLNSAGVLDGYPDGSFRPNANITRGEFAKVISAFFDGAYTGEDMFNDINGHWAASFINIAASYGWIEGYPGGTYRPDNYITRAEAISLLNRVLERNPEEMDDLLDEMKVWSDNRDTSKWYYIDIQEASNSHEYERKVNGREKWLELIH